MTFTPRCSLGMDNSHEHSTLRLSQISLEIWADLPSLKMPVCIESCVLCHVLNTGLLYCHTLRSMHYFLGSLLSVALSYAKSLK